MDSLTAQVLAAQAGDLDAFGDLVRRFQNLAYGCAYAILADSHLAEDVAQEAFLDAFRRLGDLREPKAFPGWLRRIVLTRCHRLTRRRRIDTAALSEAADAPCQADPPDRELATREAHEEVLAAVRSLSEPQRLATTLFYMGGYSCADVAAFLGISVGAVRKRLHDARGNLRERMAGMVGEALKRNVPEPDEKAEQVCFLLTLAGQLEEGVPVLAALRQFAGRARTPALRQAVSRIVDGIQHGGSISGALAQCGDLFPPMVVSLVRDGERCGCLETTSRMAGEWLRTGTCQADPELYRGARSPVEDILLEASAKGAKEVVLAVPAGAAAFRPLFVLADGTQEEYSAAMSTRQMPELEDDLKRHTILDVEQTGDELSGTLRLPRVHHGNNPPCRVRYCPGHDGLVVRIALR